MMSYIQITRLMNNEEETNKSVYFCPILEMKQEQNGAETLKYRQ